MKSLVVFLAIIGFAVSTCVDPRAEFINFKTSFVRKYQSSSEEDKKYQVFRKNLEAIEEHNARYKAGLETYYKGVDQFTDMTTEEFEALLTVEEPPAEVYENITEYQPPAGARFLSSVDYRSKGACNTPRDQGACGSCWAFTAVSVLESHIFLKTGKLHRLSPQYLIDCDKKKSHGCEGGHPEMAFDYITENGIATEDDYPYRGRDEQCKQAKKVAGFKIIRWQRVLSEYGIQLVLGLGPVAVAVDASEWGGYKGGIFQARQPFKEVDHAVVVDGYGVENGIQYWLIRNSWGSSWGEKGYIRIRKGIDQIGIGSRCSVPLLE